MPGFQGDRAAEFFISTTAAPRGGPDIEQAEAAEAAALREIEAHLSPESRHIVLDLLAGKPLRSAAPAAPGSDQGHYISGVRGSTPQWIGRYERFYAARAHRAAEVRRAASIARARERNGIGIVVALGAPTPGTQAMILRRQATLPFEVIVLDARSSGVTLGGALAALNQTRAEYGDDLEDDLIIGLREAHATKLDAAFGRRLDALISRLRTAEFRDIPDIGHVRAVDSSSTEFGAISASATRP
jgi:hypothetical protein